MRIKNYLMIGLPTLGFLFALVAYWHHNSNTQPMIVLPLNESCQLHKDACTTDFGDIHITLTPHTHPIPIAKGIDFTATLENLSAKRVQLDINGRNMYMGYNRIDLKQQDTQHWTGKSLLAFCTIDAMQWQLTLIIDAEDGTQWQVPFPLTTPYTQ